MTKQLIATEDAAPPAGPYSQAVVASGMLYLSGQGPNTPAGERVTETFAQQARLTFENLRAVASAAGGSLGDAVRVGVYLRDMSDFEEMNSIYAEFFGPSFPARTTIQSDLPGFDIEVDAVVLLPESR
jgi:2-iminobutanoate/2-iminopropanoate deaminase